MREGREAQWWKKSLPFLLPTASTPLYPPEQLLLPPGLGAASLGTLLAWSRSSL